MILIRGRAPRTAPQRPGAAFLDRDGVITRRLRPGEYVTSPSQAQLLPGAAEAIAALNREGWRVIVVTNQRGIALGRMSARRFREVQRAVAVELAERGAFLDAVLCCPHHEAACECRKPKVGMFLRARRELAPLDLEQSVMVGDERSDMEAAARLGMARVLVADAADESVQAVCAECQVSIVARSLAEAVDGYLLPAGALAGV